MSRSDVLIVGAGPVGLVAACELKRHGIEARIVERLIEPTTQSRAAAVQPRTLESLAPLGVSDELIAHGSPQRTFDTYGGRDGTRHLARFDMANIASRYKFVLDIPQSETEAVLNACATRMGITVERGVTVSELHDQGDTVTALLKSATTQEEVTASWVIGAEGASSVVRAACGQRLEGWADGDYAVYADVEVDMDFPYDSTTMITDARGQRSVRPMGGTRVRLAFPVQDELDLETTPTLEEVQGLCDTMLNRRVRILESHWLLYYRAHRGLAPQFRVGRMLLAGDAGHVHPPAGGQGMNTGIQDAVNAAWRLALVVKGHSGPELLDGYQQERHMVAAEIVSGTSKLSMLMSGAGATAVARQTVLFALGHIHALNDLVATKAAQLWIDYSSCGTVIGPDGRKGSHAGEHMPDAPGLRLAGREVTVPELIERPEHTVFAFGATQAQTAVLAELLRPFGSVVTVGADPGQLHDADRHLATAFGHRQHRDHRGTTRRLHRTRRQHCRPGSPRQLSAHSAAPRVRVLTSCAVDARPRSRVLPLLGG